MKGHLTGILATGALLTGMFLTGCAGGPGFSGAHINTDLQPQQVAQNIHATRGETVLWGGRIVQASPGSESTTLEIVAFPLQRDQKPYDKHDSIGRFLMTHPGYLEPEDYRTDRLITVVGTVEETREGMVGDASYRYPVIQANEFYLWPERQAVQPEPSVRFGVGIGIFR